MGKKITATQPAPAAKANKRALSEIDDIFSTKPTSKPAAASIETAPAPLTKKAKKKQQKAAAAAADASSEPATSSEPTSAKKLVSAVKVVDFSSAHSLGAPVLDVPAPQPSSSNGSANGVTGEPVAKRRKVESMDEFLGKSDKKRFTEDGYPLFFMEDLMAQEGGDTEQCPFECECCF
ncbi:hypothetical protein BC828DRAFT_412114 [Blastocladiella britannica]|nr:hypothetical protein BC828DRAFT_412114 [Blastocladiella britannica]